MEKDDLKVWAGRVLAWLYFRRGYRQDLLRQSFEDFIRFVSWQDAARILKESGFDIEREFERVETRMEQEIAIWETVRDAEDC